MDSATFPYGECECRGGCGCEKKAGPAAFAVVRDGKTMKVCTRCDLSSDKGTKTLLFTESDECKVLYDYDALGFFCIVGMLAEKDATPLSNEPTGTLECLWPEGHPYAVIACPCGYKRPSDAKPPTGAP